MWHRHLRPRIGRQRARLLLLPLLSAPRLPPHILRFPGLLLLQPLLISLVHLLLLQHSLLVCLHRLLLINPLLIHLLSRLLLLHSLLVR